MNWGRELVLSIPQRVLPGREAGYIQGIVWGFKDGLNWQDYQQTKIIGLAHIMVASGANVFWLVGGVIEMSAWLIGRKKSIVVGLMLGWWYVWISGFNPPIVRAILLLCIRYGAEIVGRQFVWSRALVLVCLIVFLADRDMFLSLSFWLSMVAFMGIASAPRSQLWLIDQFRKNWWVSLWLWPMLGLAFGRVSLIGLVAGPMVMPLVELITAGGFLGTAGYIIFPWLGEKLFYLAGCLVDCLIYLSDSFSKWPVAQINFTPQKWLVVVWYIILIGIAGYKIKKEIR